MDELDHAACEQEPIAHLGAVQPHGALLVCDAAACRILAVSPGLGALLGAPPGTGDPVPGDDPAAVLDPALLAALRALPAEALTPRPMPGDGPSLDPRLECLAHRSADGLVVEWLFSNGSAPQLPQEVRAAMRTQIDRAEGNVYAGSQRLAREMRRLSGYDRVMVYRFHPDWSGEVIAEARRPDLSPFLGLRYPATDIPAQARDLYRRCLLRVVADVQDVPLRISDSGTPPDLSLAVLRSVSPVHIQYLRNMGVRATLTVSVLLRGQLWGLVACHHDLPRLPGRALRTAMVEAAAAFTPLLERAEAVQAARLRTGAAALARIARGPPQDLLVNLMLGHEGLMTLVGADGIAWVDGQRVLALGLTPELPALRELAGAAAPPGSLTALDRLGLPTQAEPHRVLPAGMLATAVPGGGWLALFRRELQQEIHWAGNPERSMEPGPQGELSPRRSFALWREVVRGCARAWSDRDRALLALAAEILAAQSDAPGPAAGAAWALLAMTRVANPRLRALTEMLALQSAAILLARHDTDVAAESEVAYVSPELCRLLGCDAESILRLSWGEAAPVLGLSTRTRDPGLGDALLIPAFSPEHGPLMLRMRLETALRVQDGGQLRRFDILSVQDDTRQERLGGALHAAALQTQAARRGRDAFLRNAGHELRTPLNAVIGFADLLASHDAAPLPAQTVRDYAAEIARAGRSLLELVENILSVSRLEAGRLVPRQESFDLVGLLRDEAEMMAPLFAQKPVTLLLDLPAEMPFQSDRALLRQVVLNLLSNALKFTPPNGRVTCGLRIAIGLAEITVTDTGAGIAASDQDRIFEAFEQGDGSVTRQHAGAGLGLFIARNVADVLGGSLTLQSSPGLGSRFCLRLPREDAP